MWQIYQDSKSIHSIQLEGLQVYSLVFADEPMLLVRLKEDFSGGLEQESLVPAKAISTQRSRSKRRLGK
jgi:hypothetical protein